MLQVSERRDSPAFALFNLAFRPFFLGAALFGVVATLIWMAVFAFGQPLQAYGLPAMHWHAHEMIYGYAMAVVAGFLLTAVKNWTGQQTLHGLPLALLFGVWIAGRVLPLLGDTVSLPVIAVVDNLFLLLLLAATLQPVLKVRQWKQLGLLAKLLLMLAANSVFYLGAMGLLEQGVYWGLYSGVYLILALIFTMGRRVIPFFIEKGVEETVSLTNRRWLDISSLVLFVLFWLAEMLSPNSLAVGALAAALFLLHARRLADWHTPGIWSKPLLWSLFLAYAAMVAGFALKAAVPLLGLSPYLALHAFTVGGIGMMTLGMMARVALGHTGRNVFEPPAVLTPIFLCLLASVLLRVLAPLIDGGHYRLWIGLSQGFWIAAFAGFLLVYAGMLIKPRVDGQYG